MMKNFKILSLSLLFFGILAGAQKIGVVDTNYILGKMPQYKEAESRLNAQVDTWQKEVADMQADYDRKKLVFENEKVLLVGDQLKQRRQEVEDFEKKIKKIIDLRFGTNGEINKTRSNLVKPFQDQIWTAIETVSQKNSLGIVLDKSNGANVIFLEKKYDYTDKVLDLLLKNQRDDRPAQKQKKNN